MFTARRTNSLRPQQFPGLDNDRSLDKPDEAGASHRNLGIGRDCAVLTRGVPDGDRDGPGKFFFWEGVP